jgi:CubicO group peptidase (beta-lactamase class C family)
VSRLRLPASLFLLPWLAACGNQPLDAPLTPEALQAVAEDPGAPTERVARQVDDLFTAAGIGETRAVVLLHDGEIAAERYAPGYDPDTRFVSWSMAKTMTAAMIGALIAEGKLELDAPAPVAEWQRAGDPREAITLRHLLQMRSGLRHTEAGDPPYESSEVRMLFLDGRDDMAAFARAQPLEDEPGERFEYSSNSSVILADIAARALTGSADPDKRSAAVTGFLNSRLFAPLGMTSTVPELDAAGTFIGGSLLHATARDYARFGDMLRRGGVTREGVRLLPEAWIEAMVEPSPASPHYGMQTWLNRHHGEARHPLFPERAPESVFALIGHMGQYVVVSPEQNLVLVRLGHSDADERERLRDQMADILELYPVR